MGCNYKISAVTIAVLTIVFASLQFTKTIYELKYEHYYREKYALEVQKTQQVAHREGDMMIANNQNDAENKKINEYEKFKVDQNAKWNGKYFRAVRIGSVICNVISILTGLAIYSVVSDDINKNQRKRHLLLPYIIWHTLGAIILAVACIYTAIVYRQFISVMANQLLMSACLVLILILCITMVTKYFLSLSKATAFSYAQMDEVDEAKKTLA